MHQVAALPERVRIFSGERDFSGSLGRSPLSGHKKYLHPHKRPDKLHGNPGNHHKQYTGRDAIVKEFTRGELL